MGETTREQTHLLRHFGALVERALRLPAVPTADWCDELAQVIAGIAPGATALTMAVSLDTSGQVTAREAIGVARSAVPGDRNAAAAMPHLESLRGHAFRLDNLCCLMPGLGGSEAVISTMDRVDAGWRQGPVGRLWLAPRQDVLVAARQLSGPGMRVLVVQVCPPASAAVPIQDMLTLLAELGPWIFDRACKALANTHGDPREWLSDREQAVLELLVRGCSAKDIAQKLDRSPHTIHDHIKALHRKLRARSRGEVISRALGLYSGAAPSATPPPRPPAPIDMLASIGVAADVKARAVALRLSDLSPTHRAPTDLAPPGATDPRDGAPNGRHP